MRVYFDPSFLISLYVPELSSPKTRALVENLGAPILVNELQELESKNGVRQKVLRRDIEHSDLSRCLRVFDDDIVLGKIRLKKIVWSAAFAKAEKLSSHHGATRVCRSFDLLHVAIAVASGVKRFATLDGPQAELASAAGLSVFPR